MKPRMPAASQRPPAGSSGAADPTSRGTSTSRAASPEPAQAASRGDASGGQPLVSARGVTKRFGTGEEAVVALADVSLDVAAGDFVSLIGPSGCGKSTLLRTVADLTSPTDGEVLVGGKSAHQARRDRDYGMVFQKATLFNWRTVRRNVELPLEIMGWSREERTRRAEEMLELVELGEFARKRPQQLSGGMQQRVAIARALAFEPSLLLMDEPFGALDEITRERLNDELLRIWQTTGTTVIFVTHSIPEAVFLSSRIVVMSPRPGRVLAEIDVDLPYPRGEDTREHPRYFELVTEVRETLRAAERT
jgi:NitT/TauT family transport system ATP-binding protein